VGSMPSLFESLASITSDRRAAFLTWPETTLL
jgi:hypothetical protein